MRAEREREYLIMPVEMVRLPAVGCVGGERERESGTGRGGCVES